MKYIYILSIFTFFLTSCIKEESPISPVSRSSNFDKVALGSNYAEQIYYDLENKKIVSSNPFVAWDIALNSQSYRHTLVLNTAKFMAIYPIEGKTFDEVSLADYKKIKESMWLHDAPSGNQDSTAFGEWLENEETLEPKDLVYIIDRGKNPEGDLIGHWKMQIINATQESVTIKLQNLRTDDAFESTIIKNPEVNFTQFSFDDKSQVTLAPPKDTWDVVFTKHTELLFTSEGDSLWYGVTSLLLNPNGCKATFNSDSTYNLITIDSLENYTLHTDRNSIGHDWKYYNLEVGVYIMRYENTYLIQSRNGYFYKLRFTSFTNESGVKGYPEFEFEAL